MQDLTNLLRPQTVALVGASNDPTKFGGKVAYNIVRSGIAKSWFIHARGEDVLGRSTFKRLSALPEVPDCVVLAVTADAALQELDAAGALGVRSAVLFASGFGEAGPQGLTRVAELRAIATRHGMAVLGPNCVGMANFVDGMLLSSAEGLEMEEAGSVALISQSGSLGIAVSSRQAQRFSHFISTGNETVLGAADFVRWLAPREPRIKTFALLLESIPDRNALVAAVAAAHSNGKRVVMLKLTGDAASDRIAALHTGALSGARAPLESFCRQHGVILARTLREFNAVLTLLSSARYRGGRRLGVYTTSGGSAVLAAGFAISQGLELPQPSVATEHALARILGMEADRVTNPLDTTGINAFMPLRFAEGLKAFANDGGFDLVLLPLGGAQGKDASDRVSAVLEVAASALVPIVLVWQQQRLLEEEAFRKLYSSHCPYFMDFESAIEAVALVDDATAPHATRTAAVESHDVISAAPTFVDVLGRLAESGVPIARLERVFEGGAHNVLSTLGEPVALKVSHPRLLHKSDANLVVFPVNSVDELAAEARRMGEAARAMGLEDAQVFAQAAVGAGLELLCGFDRDVEMGPYLVLGAGGIYTELFQDSVVVLIEPQQDFAVRVANALESLRIAPLLRGARGQKPLDFAAAVAAISAAARCFSATPQWRAMEINPLTVGTSGALVVDGRALLN